MCQLARVASPRLASGLSLVLAAGCGLLPAQKGVHAVAEFDHGEIAASYVVTLPEGYTAERRWALILDFHGAIAPSRHGAEVTRDRLWSQATGQVPAIVVGLNGRTRAWGTIAGERDDEAFARAVLVEVSAELPVDPERIYLAGFSSGSDFLCKGVLQRRPGFAASLVTCPGPPSVVGLKDGALLSVAKHPFYFVAGEEDWIRKDGAWQAFLALDAKRARVMYREVPDTAHTFFPPAEYARLFSYLEYLAGTDDSRDDLALARAALEHEDYLCASTHLLRVKDREGKKLLAEILERGQGLLAEAKAVDANADPGEAYERWWRLRTQFHRFPAIAGAAVAALKELDSGDRRALGQARRAYFDARKERREPEPRAVAALPPEPLWTFDRYLDDVAVEAHLVDLATRFPDRARLHRIGKSIEGRDLCVLEIGVGEPSESPAVFVQGGLHGNEVSTVTTVLYFALQCVANPERRRGVDRLTRGTTFYFLPVANPDALHHHLGAAFSHWRPRYNSRPYDADGDGKIDEDGSEDLDGDGEIGLMYRPDPNGGYVLRDGRLVRGDGAERYTLVGREGIDDDGDGKFGEDPVGGVDLNRNFPIGFHERHAFEGHTGKTALSEPETAAITSFVAAHPSIGLFLDYHNDAHCVFYWHGADDDDADIALMRDAAARAETALEYVPRPLTHEGAGLGIAWAFGAMGIPALLVELEASRGDPAAYLETAWGGGFVAPRAFVHPQLGEVLIGNELRKLAKRNPHPRDITWQAERNFAWARAEMARLPRLELRDVRITPRDDGIVIAGVIANAGGMPTDTLRAVRLGRAVAVSVGAEGADVDGTTTYGTLAAGATVPFRVVLRPTTAAVSLVVSHPRGGTVRHRIARPRLASAPIRRDYVIEDGYAPPERAIVAGNDFFTAGVAAEERGPAFKPTRDGRELRLAVVLGEWEDHRSTHDPEDFARAMFSADGFGTTSPTGQQVYGSVAEFYREMSYGNSTVRGEVFGWYRLPGAYADYRDASFGSSIVQDRLLEALFADEGAGALDRFDGVAFLWAGNTVKRTSALWPMRLTLKAFPDIAAFKAGELHQGEFLPIGVACHELAHTFGVNDKYGLGAPTDPFGPFCLMARGTHGGEPSGRHRPFPLCAWCRTVIGWVKPVVIDPATPQRLALRPTLSGPRECYRILLKPDGSEYLLLENRRREGFCTDLPSAGLFVLRVGPNDLPSAPQKRVQLLPAHGLRARAGDPVHLEAVAWPQPGHAELIVDHVKLSAIRLTDDVIYFEVGPSTK